MIRIMIADDQELIRESLKIVLEMNEDMEVAAMASNGREALAALAKMPIDIILMDIRMPELDGVLCTKAVKERYPDVRIIILTTFDDDDYVYSALKYGASGYLLKGGSVQELADAIRIVVSGGNILNPDVTNKVVKLFSQMAHGSYVAETDLQGLQDLSHTERSNEEHEKDESDFSLRVNLTHPRPPSSAKVRSARPRVQAVCGRADSALRVLC